MESFALTIVIPAHNSAAFIRETLECVLDQRVDRCEIIVIENGSTDETKDILHEFGNRVRCLSLNEPGVSQARNVGISEARGKYLIFLDADDLLVQGSLSRQMDFLDRKDEIAAVFSDTLCFADDETGKREIWPFPVRKRRLRALGLPTRNQWYFLNENLLPIGSVMARTASIRETGGFDKDLNGIEDWEFWFRFGGSNRFAYLPGQALMYRVHGSGLSRDDALMRGRTLKLMKNLHASEFFKALPRSRKSVHYLMLGGGFLSRRQVDLARLNFKRAIRENIFNGPAWIAYALVSWLPGRSPAIFDRIRRWIP